MTAFIAIMLIAGLSALLVAAVMKSQDGYEDNSGFHPGNSHTA